MVVPSVIPALRQEDGAFKASLGDMWITLSRTAD
jgi:hypothetical protein